MTIMGIAEEEDRNKAILLLKNDDETRFGFLSSKLKESLFLERGKYPTAVSIMFELMVKYNCSMR